MTDADVGKLWDRAASWHVSVEVDSIVQMASFETGTWHASGHINGVGPSNRTSVGLELVGWEKGPFPDGQVQQACRLWRAIVQSYGIPRANAMVQHSVLDPARRSDPGKVWMSTHAQRVLDFAFA
jgi:N-acetyl-anhydromuramyl-L-alanine amidase AmpD